MLESRTKAPSSRFRTSQRRPLACQECGKKKVKCDKQLPCARCLRLGLQCSREVVRIKHNVVRHADEIEFLESVTADLEILPSSEALQSVIQKLKHRSRRLQFGGDAAFLLENGPQSPRLGDMETHAQFGSPSLDTIRYIEEAGIRVPSLNDARKLVQFHLQYLAWHHNCLHAPTFMEECDVFWGTGRCVHPLWLAVYLCVLSVTVFAIENSAKSQRSVGVDLEQLPSARELFQGFVNVLHRCNFLGEVNMYAVQAIVMSNEVANNLGQSQLNSNLFSAAVRIAEYLGMHRIQDSGSPSTKASMSWQERVEREVGKRIWSSMMVQDHFAIHFTDSYTISPAHVSTSVPLNADDHDLVEMPRHVPTVSSYMRVLCEMAEMMPDLLDGLGITNNQRSVSERYKHVLSMDRRMRETVRRFPPCFLKQDPENEARLPWLHIARRSLAITAAEKIIMIHRPFLIRSYQVPRYDFTRRTCTAAARTILREHDALAQADDLCVWTHTPFCITAAVILCFEINSAGDGDESTVASHRAAVIATRQRLAHRKSDVLAQRGVALLDILLDQPANHDVSALSTRVMTEIDRIPMTPLGVSDAEKDMAWYGVCAGNLWSEGLMAETVEDRPSDSEPSPGQERIDFDVWFESMFVNFEQHDES
ncbi:Monooxygenase, FAD-binding [Pleurostoma richardsiae]|uniref:Monooxygenase, FAD-binding n=1 Tax=Pleurostoma richardsiae TaxID=41990 RepID=A0AA38RTY2_9PEZI|nr:Monooxygenase, FAD-binding [Pleurostoma richardsiae]